MAQESYRSALDLIGQIYDAALEPARWTGVVEHVLEFVQAKSGLLFTPFDRIDTDGFSFPVNVSQDFLQRYASRYQQHDPWARAAFEEGLAKAGTVVVGDDVVPRARLLKSAFYKEFLRPQDTSRICVAFVFGGGEQVGVLNTALTVHRSVRSRPFSLRSRGRMELLVPHLSRALGVMFRLRNAELKLAITTAALDRLASGIVLIGEGRRVVFANCAAQRLLGEGDGLVLVPMAGGGECLGASTPGTSAKIDEALIQTLDPHMLKVPHFSRAITVPRGIRRSPLVLNVSGLAEANAFGKSIGSARAIVFITDPNQAAKLDDSLARQLFGLTHAEVRLARELCAGRTVAESAMRLGVQESTLRTQLRGLFAKTETSRQPELLQVLLSISSGLR